MRADELIEEYKALARNCYQVDYSDKQAVKKNNDSITKMYQIIETIHEEFGDEGLLKIYQLLDNRDFQINLLVATHILEKIPVDKQTEQKALDMIKKIASGNDLLAQGYQIWIKNWSSNQH